MRFSKKNTYSVSMLKDLYGYSKSAKYKYKIAVVDKDGFRKTTYYDFVKTCNSIAYWLKKQELGVADVVAIELGRCMEHYAVRIACHFIGAICLSINPGTPKNRKDRLYKDCKPKIIIDNNLLQSIPIKNFECQIDESLDDSNLGYIVYTSGTTGIPKGILHNRSLYELYQNCMDYIDAPSYKKLHKPLTHRHVALSDFSFVLSYIDIAILFGHGCIHILSEYMINDVEQIRNYFISNNIDSTFILPSLLNEILPLDSLVYACVAGEKSNFDFTKYDTQIYNVYGSSEIPVMGFAKYGDNLIGEDFGSQRVFLTDRNSGHILSENSKSKGELAFSGPGLMCKYVNDENLTHQKIVISQILGESVYFSGDIGKYMANGLIQILGREDSTVKIRGKRVDLSEIEYHFSKIDDIKEFAIKAFVENNDTFIAIFYSTNSSKPKKDAELIGVLSKDLNDYMVPAYYVHVDDFKRSEHGKIDIKSLELPFQNVNSKNQSKYKDGNVDFSYDGIVDYLLYQSSQILHGIQVKPDSDLISLGFNSLNAMKLQSAILSHYGINITASEMMKLSSVNLITKQISLKLASNSIEDSVFNKYTFREKVPLTESQLNVYLDEVSKNDCGTAYNNPVKIVLPSDFSAKNITDSVKALLIKFPILKARIDSNEENPILSFDANIKVLKKDKPYKVDKNFVRPFKLYRQLARFIFINNNKEKILYADFHHIIADGMSINILLTQLYKYLNIKEIYYNKIISDTGILKECEFSKKIQKSSKFKDAKDFFDKELCEVDQAGELLPSIGNNKPNSIHGKLKFKSSLLKKFLLKNSLTLNHFLTSVFGYTLSRYCGSDNSLFCIIEDGRGQIDVSNSVGMFVKTMPIMLDCSNRSVDNFLHASKNKILKILDYDFYPFRLLAKDYGINSNITFQYSHNIRTNKKQVIDFSELKHDYVSEFSLNVYNSLDNNLAFILEHSKKYSDEFCNRLMLTFEKVLHGFLTKDELSDINLVTKDDLYIFSQINKTDTPLKYDDILQAFSHALNKKPNNTLVTYKDKTYTYAQGAYIADEIAHVLNKAHIKQKSHIAIFVNRSEWYLLAALGVITQGSSYVPIDDTYPDERIKFMLKDTKANAILVTDKTSRHTEKLIQENKISIKIINLSKINIPTQTQAENQAKIYSYVKSDRHDTACVLYTSGTTGKPKGSLITRLAILNVSEWYIQYTHMNTQDVYGLYTAFTFDMHVLGLYPHLMVGAHLDIVPEDKRLNLSELNKHYIKHFTTHTFITTNVAKMFVNQIDKTTIKFLLVIGEKLGEFTAPEWIGMCESYGPTESLALVSAIPVNERKHSTSIGKIFSNIKAYILDNNKCQVPVGAVGELYISGYQLAKGYLNRSEETNNAFIDNPFDKDFPEYEKMYKTGDLVRILPDNTLGFIGRRDSQIKIRGNRVETGEVESCIRELDVIKDVTVQAIEIKNTKELVAYCVLNKNTDTSDIEQTIKTHVSDNKPAYMVPAFVVVIDKIPLNVNGKVDKRKLPTPNASDLQVEYVPAQTETQALLIDAFERVLNVKPIGINDDFIRLGGDSIKAMQASVKLSSLCLSAYDILQYRTALILSNHIDKKTNNYKKELDIVLSDSKKISEQIIQRQRFVNGSCIEVPLSEPQINIYTDCLSHNLLNSYTRKFIFSIPDSYDDNKVYKMLEMLYYKIPIFYSRIKYSDNDIYLSCDGFINWQGFFDECDTEIIDMIDKQSFNFEESLIRFYGLFKKSSKFLVCDIHHLIFDYTSVPLIDNAINNAIKGKYPNEIDYGFVYDSCFCDRIKSSSLIDKSLSYYSNLLKNVNGSTKLTKNNLNYNYDKNECGKEFYELLDISMQDLARFASQKSSTQGSVLLASFAYTLFLFSNNLDEDKVVFASLDASRSRLNLQNSIGCFLRTITIVVDVSDKSIDRYISETTNIFISSMDLNFCPYQTLVSKYNIDSNIIFNYNPRSLLSHPEFNNIQENNIRKLDAVYDSFVTNDIEFGIYEYKKSIIVRPKFSNKFSVVFMKKFSSCFNIVLNKFLTCKNLGEIKKSYLM